MTSKEVVELSFIPPRCQENGCHLHSATTEGQEASLGFIESYKYSDNVFSTSLSEV